MRRRTNLDEVVRRRRPSYDIIHKKGAFVMYMSVVHNFSKGDMSVKS